MTGRIRMAGPCPPRISGSPSAGTFSCQSLEDGNGQKGPPPVRFPTGRRNYYSSFAYQMYSKALIISFPNLPNIPMFTFLLLDLPLGLSVPVQRSFPPRLRWSATMIATRDRTCHHLAALPANPAAGARGCPTLELTHERVDDVPLLLGFLIKLRIPEIIDRQF